MHKDRRIFSAVFCVNKASPGFAPAGANKVSIIFSGDMCVGENRPSMGKEPCVGQPAFSVLFALFVSAGGSPPSPKKNKNPSKIQGCPMRSSSAGAEMLSDKEKSTENTLCILKGFDAVWGHFRPAEPHVSLPIDGKLGSQTCERQRVRCGEPLSPQTNPSTEWGLFDYTLKSTEVEPLSSCTNS